MKRLAALAAVSRPSPMAVLLSTSIVVGLALTTGCTERPQPVFPSSAQNLPSSASDLMQAASATVGEHASAAVGQVASMPSVQGMTDTVGQGVANMVDNVKSSLASGYDWSAIKERLSAEEKAGHLQISEVGDKLKLTIPSSMAFAHAKARFNPALTPVLDTVADIMSKHADLEGTVTGHTDNTGRADRNEKLAIARATSVVDYLSGHGVAGSRLHADGKGESAPIASNDTAEGRAENRRVDILLRSSLVR